MTPKEAKTEKKKGVNCPLCTKEMVVSAEFTTWTPEEQRILQETLKPVSEAIKTIVEYLNHAESTNNMTKRTSVMSMVIENIIDNTFTNAYYRLGILDSIMHRIRTDAELRKIKTLMMINNKKRKQMANDKASSYIG